MQESKRSPERIAFVVDTEDYSGNFERGMCAYLTGHKEEYFCEPDDKLADETLKSLPEDVAKYFNEHVVEVLDTNQSYPYHTAVTIWPTPGWFNNGMGGEFKHGQEEEAEKAHEKSCGEYNKEHPTADVKHTKLHKFPSYQSVAIYFDEVPPKHILDLMKARAQEYCKTRLDILGKPGPLTFTGCRVMKEFVKTDYEYTEV